MENQPVYTSVFVDNKGKHEKKPHSVSLFGSYLTGWYENNYVCVTN